MTLSDMAEQSPRKFSLPSFQEGFGRTPSLRPRISEGGYVNTVNVPSIPLPNWLNALDASAPTFSAASTTTDAASRWLHETPDRPRQSTPAESGHIFSHFSAFDDPLQASDDGALEARRVEGGIEKLNRHRHPDVPEAARDNSSFIGHGVQAPETTSQPTTSEGRTVSRVTDRARGKHYTHD